MLVDSHCHINFAEFQDDFAPMLKRAKDADVLILELISTKLSDMPKIIEIIENHENIYASIGIHPCNVTKETVGALGEFSHLLKYAGHAKINAIGETGLDFYHANDNKLLQIESFKEHIQAARSLNYPVIIHNRQAEDEVIKVIEEEIKQNGDFKILIHCFTSTSDFANKIIELGGYISISGIITFKNAKQLQEVVKNIPLDRLLIETDAPYLAPMPFRGKRNEPSYILHTALFLAELLEVDYQLLAAKTTENFLKLFRV